MAGGVRIRRQAGVDQDRVGARGIQHAPGFTGDACAVQAAAVAHRERRWQVDEAAGGRDEFAQDTRSGTADHQVDRPTLRRELLLSQEQLARMLSLSRQTVNEVLAGLEADGLIRRRRRVIELLDPDRLHKDGAEPGDAPDETDVEPVDKYVDKV